jgi:bifunctional DNA-binding transcriptional regulator/antitoxin component of YhaV-PrlF toxin-antitoxin module
MERRACNLPLELLSDGLLLYPYMDAAVTNQPQENKPVKEVIGKLSSKSAVTLPVEVRRFLGVKPKGKVIFQIRDKTVEIKPVMTLEEAMGSVLALSPPKDWKTIRAEVIEDKVERFITKM